MPDPVPDPLPQHCPTPRELDDLELLLAGSLPGRSTYDDEITLDLPEALRGRDVELVDPEGLPLAALAADGVLTPLTRASHGPFRHLRLTPDEVADRYVGRLVVVLDGPVDGPELQQIRRAALEDGVLLLALCGVGTPEGLTPVGLVRATVAARDLLTGIGVTADVVACPLATHGDAELDARLRAEVVAAYARSGELLELTPRAGQLPEAVAAVVEQDQPPVDRRGFVVLFTGLSGSGKSTLAQALHDRLLEDGRRTVTSLDGDVVRRHLSAGLTFSREDRDTNIRRIGWVAAEIARHRGVALCSPIAPFDSTRQAVRAMVEDAGGTFVLVHVATPLEECERRDRKGLYAKARRGEIPDFTGISSPYEEPHDATVRVDTTGRSIEECLAEILPVLPLRLGGVRD